MKQASLTHRTWRSTVGVVTAASTIVAGWAPVAHAAPATPQRDNALRQQAAAAADGTYESCGAYFGYGKSENGVLDVVQFDVADQNGSDGAMHAVGTDTQVVLHLENKVGDVIECTPVEVTKAMWDSAQADDPFPYINVSDDHPLPAWPGPGHYIYPSVTFGPSIGDFGMIYSIGFKVTSVPTGHTLVSPTAVQPLVVHYPAGVNDFSNVNDPLVLDYITSTAGAAASSAFAAALTSCGVDGDGEAVFGTDLNAAIDALRTYQGRSLYPGDYSCYTVLNSNALVSFLLNFHATVTYSEPIVLRVPEAPTTTTTTTTTTTPSKPAAVAATPVAATPTYTG